ncbi:MULTISPECIES: cell division protein FtsZ [Halobacterium]|uniref:Cell division protein FtsZ 2 n=4 Tax=Halobacterium salinarum TaxID=2242 RepID=FTSZ2_HALSA|nr:MULTISPECIES: cell division protein FtsZ [Halobacterium]B0R2V3.1 RecName: Full=Cell division protein FtsZ 2 [Halobacterium salinarum R1]P0DMR7.1 RecName: Full=Cell division protein FtsZ 2 [Halobacterium salinarum NRC-1]MBB6090775.1 cell division protein FtsZ [Halobacterium salinarum]MCF2166112.1 cell division protein FtsZ [Halobacterium salinarum]MCF2166794.1 cell division protein FtsZ [Halobacterium salinarum]MCF2206469.1 cell division protein FtsZ [Halobacterium salinarum]MCF2239677.1 c
MQDIVQDALDNAEAEQREMDGDGDGDEFGDPRIVIVGCGGAGNNTVNRLYNIGVEGADTVAINTDKQHLKMIKADTKILVGKSLTNGLGAGGDPSMGERATEMAQGTIKEVLGDADLVFVTAGMGGGTGTGAAPVVSKIAKEQGAIVVGMVSTPFNVERARTVKAEEGLEKLREKADSIIVLDNNRLLDYVPNLPIGKAFSVMDQIIAETVKGISETITQPSLINLDYADMTAIMNQGGVAVMLVGETQDKNKTNEVVKDAMNHPLLDVDYRGASGGLVHITGGPDLTLKEAEGIADNITERLDASANVIWGARIQESYKGKVRVMAIMTGVQSAQVLGPSTQKQADKSRRELQDVDSKQRAADDAGAGGFGGAHSDGGQDEVEQENGLDVIR